MIHRDSEMSHRSFQENTGFIDELHSKSTSNLIENAN